MRKTSTRDVTFIGSGHVATHLALALKGAGVSVRQVMSLHLDHAARLASLVGAEAIDRVDRLDPSASAFILAVADDVLYRLPASLHLGDALLLHTSGSTPIKVLADASSRHGVVWSPQTFVRDVPMDYSALPLCIEGNNQRTEADIAALFGTFTSNISRLDFDQRRWAHLAAVMVSNFGNAINAMAEGMLARQGIRFSLLQPLAEATAAKTLHGPLWPQQTGPAVRRDSRTLDAQRALLTDNPQALALYNLMTDIIQSQ